MAVKLSPLFCDAQLDANGNAAVGFLLYTYVAASTTPQTTYQDSGGLTQHTNPIELNARGEPPAPIWLTAGVTYKFALKTAADVTVRTVDNVGGVNDTTSALDQWVSGPAPTFISTTSFSLVGDQTAAFHVGRRVKTTNSGGTVYSTISVSAFGAVTTVTVVNDSGVLDSGLSAVSYGLITNVNSSVPSFQAKGDLLTQSAAGTLSRLAVGTDFFDLAADASKTSGLVYRKPVGAVSSGKTIAARTNSGAPTTTIDITADELVVRDSSGGAVVLQTVSVSAAITSSGANGLDTGAEAGNTWYYGWVIAKPDGTVAALLSVSSSAPTLPAGYTFKALVTAVRNNGSSNFIAYRQFGNRVYYEGLQNVLSGGTSTGEATVSVATVVPPIALDFQTQFQLTGTTDGSGILVLTTNVRFIAGVNWAVIAIGLNGLANTTGQNPALGFTERFIPQISQQFFYQITVTNGSAQALSADVLGFKLPMGGE